MTKFTKKEAERIHATKRAKQRYDLEYTREIRDFIKFKIHNNKTILIRKDSNTKSVRLVEIKDYFYKIVWDSARHEVVTFLPIEEKDLEYIENPSIINDEEKETISRKNNEFKKDSKKFITENKEIFEQVESFKDFMFQMENTKVAKGE